MVNVNNKNCSDSVDKINSTSSTGSVTETTWKFAVKVMNLEADVTVMEIMDYFKKLTKTLINVSRMMKALKKYKCKHYCYVNDFDSLEEAESVCRIANGSLLKNSKLFCQVAKTPKDASYPNSQEYDEEVVIPIKNQPSLCPQRQLYLLLMESHN